MPKSFYELEQEKKQLESTEDKKVGFGRALLSNLSDVMTGNQVGSTLDSIESKQTRQNISRLQRLKEIDAEAQQLQQQEFLAAKRDPNSEISKQMANAMQQQALKMAELFKTQGLNIDPEAVSSVFINRSAEDLEQAKPMDILIEVAKMQREKEKLAMEMQDKLAARALTNRELKIKEKEANKKPEEDNRELFVPSLNVFAKTKDDAKLLKAASSNHAAFSSTIDDLITVREKVGKEFLPTAAKTKMRAMATDLLLKAKELANLGVLQKTDVEQLEKLLPQDPGAISAINVVTKLKAARDLFNNTYNSKLKAYGVAPQIQNGSDVEFGNDSDNTGDSFETSSGFVLKRK